MLPLCAANKTKRNQTKHTENPTTTKTEPNYPPHLSYRKILQMYWYVLFVATCVLAHYSLLKTTARKLYVWNIRKGMGWKIKTSLHHSNKSMVYSSLKNVSSFNHPISKTEDIKQRLPNVKCQKIKKWLFNLGKKQQADDNTCQIKRSMEKVSQGFLLFLPCNKQLKGSAEY